MFDIASRLNFTRTLGSAVMLGIMLFFSLPAATYALVPSPALSLTANPVKVDKGGAATLSWTSKNTKTCTASAGWSGSKGTSGSQTVKKITSSQAYTLTCAGTTKKVSATVKVAVKSTPPPQPPVQPVVGLNAGRNFDAVGKALTLELGAHSLRTGLATSNYDAYINWAAQNGKSVVFMLGYGDGINVKTPSGRQAYADRSAGLAQKYGAKVEYYQVWNEWNGGFGLGCNWKQPPCNDAAMYTDLLCKTYTAIKAVQPSAKVAGGVVAGANEKFITGMLDAGAGDCMDVLDVHLYVYRQTWPGHVPIDAPASVGADKFIQVINDRQNLVREMTGRTIPIIVTEAGRHNDGTPAIEALMADYITELYKRASDVPFLEGIWWYHLRDTDESRFGLVRSNNAKKPAFAAFQAAANR